MRVSIDLDDQPELVAIEVDDIRSDGFLPIEPRFFIKGHLAQVVPEMFLGGRGMETEFAGFIEQGFIVG